MVYTLPQRKIRPCHVAFFFSLVLIFVGSLIVAGLNTGPMILGTEMNDNGLVEYLCLGVRCENFSTMHWSDKS
jgi:hypothetical protein